jgi:uncharacterized protein with HEPN domain
MSERNLNLLLEDIQTSICKVLNYTKGYTFQLFEKDIKTREAVERNFEIIGEAAARIPEEFKKSHPEIEWRIIKDFRNFIIHEYFGINYQILWNTVQNRLPELENQIKKLMHENK